MQTAISTLKLRMPLQTVAPVLPQKQVVVIDKNTLQQKTNKPVKPNTQNNKAAKAQTLTDQQQEALKDKLARWKEEYKNTLALLQAKYLLCFSIPAKPLAIGSTKKL